jgi:hypothetical protein
MNNRYKYDNRRRNYRSQSSTTNGASSIVTLVFITIVLIVWIVSLKSDISQISDEKQMLKSENTELVHKIDSISKTLEESKKIVPIVEIIPKKIFRRPIKDTTKAKVEIIEIKETKVIATDTTKTTN